MSTRTTFGLTFDPANAAGGALGQAEARYVSIGATGSFYYPANKDDGFNVPQVSFNFLNAYGNDISGAPFVHIKMPGLFNVTGISDYSRAENIFSFGSDFNSQRTAYDALHDVGMADKITSGGLIDDAATQAARAGLSGAEAFQYSIKKGLGSILGFVGSAGLNNIGQFEFNARRAVNPMAQLLYKGPQVRRYQFPFVFKPRNAKDSENIKKIIGIFRVASSASVSSSGGGQEVSPGVVQPVDLGAGNSFTFGYPHLTEFRVSFFSPTSGSAKHLFRSKVCAIESVSVDYGGQKMAFFEDGSPTEINMTIQLTEVMPRTLGDAIVDANDPNITLG